MTANSRAFGFGKRNSRKSSQSNRVQHDKRQALAFINQGRLQEAEAIYKRLARQGAGSYLVFGNLGAICIMQGRTQEAITFLKEALAIKPDFPDALANLGIALKEQGNLEAAVASYRQALDLKPNYPEALSGLGIALKEQGNLEAAVASYRQALDLKPNYPEALSGLGSALGEQGDLEAAIISFRQALDLKPNYPEVLNNLGTALGEQGHLEAAVASCRQALDLQPNFPEALFNLGLSLQFQGDLEAAIASYRQALGLKPNYPDALNSLGVALVEQGDLEAAIVSHRKAVSLDHENPDYHYNISYILLLSGDYDNGWEEYEWRFKKKHVGRPHAKPPAPQWNGHNLSSEGTLMLVSEQGLGDTLQFMRYVPYLNTLCLGMDVAFCAPPKLHGLILSSGVTPRVYTPEEANAFTSGTWLPLLSLPRHLKVRSSQPLVHAPYIKAPAEKVHHWQETLATEKRPIIGIHWEGNRQAERGRDNSRLLTPWSRSRSLPLEAFAPISEATSATFLSLQKGSGAEQLDHCSFRHRFVACQEDINGIWDFVDTAAMIANCDLIITNDTVLAHLAGGLGQTTWLLLKKVPDWRWGMGGETTFWYRSMRLFRQREWGNWAEVMDRVVRALEALPPKELPPKELPPKEAESLVPVKMTLPTPEKDDEIHNPQRKDEQRALALVDQGQLQEAEEIYRKLIKQGARSHLVFSKLGAICARQGKKQEATMFLKEAVAIKADDPGTLFNLGVAFWEQGDLQAAIDSYKKVLALNPHHPKALSNLGAAFWKQGDLQAAIDSYRKVLAIKPDYPDALSNLGSALHDQGQLEAAIDSYRKALAIKPDYPDALSNLGSALHDQGQLEAAIDSYRKALAIKPDYPSFLSNLAVVLKDQEGQLEAAIELLRKAISLDPDYAPGHLNLSHALLLSGNYDNGWKEYRWRFIGSAVNIGPHACPKIEQWNGKNHDPGERLTIISEQGLGDTLQFMRYIPYLKTMEVDVCFCAQPNLHALIQASEITTTLYTFEEANALTTGKWAPLLSLPAYLNVTPDNPLTNTPYIKATEQQVLHWKQKLAAEHRPIIGISWQASQTGAKDRSLPLEAFAPIIRVAEANLLSLQKGFGSEQLMDCSFRHRFVDCQEEINQTWDFLESAAIMANCDLIITVDTVVAHLAAGLGKPTWLLLKKVPDWRWGMDGEATFWYRSMRLFRQRERGNWPEVMDRVIRALEELPIKALSTKALSTKEAESLVPAKVSLLTPGKDDGIHNDQRKDEQRALVLIDQGQLQEAEEIYRRLIKQGARSHLVFGKLGAICAMQDRNQEAVTFLKKAIAIEPGDSEVLFNLGVSLINRGDLQGAIDSYQKAIAIKPNYPRALFNLGNALKEEGHLEAAIDSYRKAIAIKPDYPGALFNLGNTLKEQDHLDAAIDAYRKAIAIKPGFPNALSNLGNALKEQGHLDAAIDVYRKALAIKPNKYTALFNLACVLQEKGDLQTAIELHKKAVSSDHENPDYHYNASYMLLLSGDYDNGWEEYEWRLKKKHVAPLLHARPPAPQWDGQTFSSGETLMLVSEQGLGDTLQFMRYVPYLNTLCLGMDVAFCAQPKLHGLILSSGITPKVYTIEEANAFTAGKWLPLLSLPRYLKVSPAQPLVQTPYIKPPAEKVHHWQEKLATEKRPIIGIHWQGNRQTERNPDHGRGLIPWSRSRSLPLEAFAPISEATSATFLSLQKGSGVEQLDHCSFRHRFVACQEDINGIWDFVDTAAMIANCDLIITNDTALAHLAGGLGQTTWLLLNKRSEWRWGMDGETTFWYRSMRLFRQRERGNWAEVMDRVIRALEALPILELPIKALSTKALSTKEAESLVPAKVSLLTPGKDDGIHNDQRKDEQRALVLIDQGQLQEAEGIYRRLIKQGARSHLVFGKLGAICAMQDRNQEAVTFLKKAIAIKPDDSEVLFNLGVSLINRGDLQGAIDSYQKAIAIKPNNPRVLFNLGNALKEEGHLEAAIDSYRKAIAIKPDYPGALFNLGNTLKEQDHLDAAIDAYRKAIAIKPGFPNALSNLGNTLKEQGHLDAAIDVYRKALAIKPNKYTALFNLACALQEKGDLQTAIELHKKAVSSDHENPDYHYNASYMLLLSGDYDNGWEEYEWRLKKKHVATLLHARPPAPQWDGQTFSSGETLMLVSEQGLGDTLQFMRYVPYLNTLCLGMDVAFCAQPKLHGLILSSGITPKVYTTEEANAFTAGKWLPLLSLPRYLKISPAQPLVQTPYIKPPAEKVHHWQEKLATEKRPIIGIHWQGNRQTERNPDHSRWLIPWSRSRSLPLEAFAPISEATSATFLSLQKGSGVEQLDHCSFRHRFVACQEDINGIWDFVDTAAMIANCDLIITNDTALAHLAGGLGQTTWLLLNKRSEWRWGMDGETTFWYRSMRLFRQRERGNWAEVMDRVVRALEELPTKALSTKEAESLVPAKVSLLTPEKDDGIHNDQREDEQRALALIDQGQLQEAEEIYRRLIKQGARSHLVFGKLGAICAMQDRNQEAVTFLKKAIAIEPDNSEVLFNLGVSLANKGDLQGGINSYRKAIAIKPDDPRALFNLGNALKEEGHLEAAIDSYRKAIAIKPDYPGALFNLGNALKEEGRLEAAIDSYRKAIAIKPDDPRALFNLGNALKEEGRLEAAIDSYQKAIVIKPDHQKALLNLGNAFNDQGQLEAAVDAYRKALIFKPNDPDALSNLGGVLHEQGDLNGAIASFREAISFDEKHIGGHVNLAHSLLLSGDYKDGWKEYEWRHCMKDHGMCHVRPQVEQWDGHNLSSEEELILVSEQGLGDTLQFMRYVYYLTKKGMNISFLCAQTKLHTLIQSSEITTKIYTLEECNQLTTGKWLPLLSLPQYLNIRPGSPLIDTPYIKVPEQKILRWKQKLAAEKRPIIGINWQGSQAGQKGRATPLEAFAPIIKTIDASLLSLQKGWGSEELAESSFRNRFVGCQEEISQTWDFVETAAMVFNCDLIITADTVVAHLAAGMGKTTWLLLQTVPEWRWGMGGETTFWYRSMRLFRQRERGNWAEVMDRVIRALEALPILELPPKETESLVPAKMTSPTPEKADGIHNAQRKDEQRALALVAQGQLQEAEEIYRRLIKQGARSHLVFSKLGAICVRQGKNQEATMFLKEAVAIKADDPGTLFNLGVAFWEQGDLQAAIDSYKKALALNPNHPQALSNLGAAFWKHGDLQAAIDSYRKALAIKPDYPDALSNLGSALHDQGNLEAAIDCYRKALAIKPDYPDVLSNLGNALKDQGNLEAAIDCYRKALAIKPDYPSVLSNLGNALKDQGQLEAAIDCHRKALAIKPDYPQALSNLAFALQEKGDLQTAIELNKKAVSLSPDYALGHLNLSIFLLLSGNYDDGWKEYRWRFSGKKVNPHACPKIEQWNGKNHEPGEQLIVISEQGLGDTLQFMRYIPYLKAMGVDACFCAQPNLHGLIQASGITTRLCKPEEANELTTGKWVPLLSLPAYLNVTPDNPLTDTPYIKAPGRQILHWKQKLAAEPRPIIGLNWQGNPQAENGHLRGRSLSLEALSPITQVTGASFLSLQKGSGSEQLMDCWFRHRFVDCQEEINQTWDFLDSAAIMANCDLIITVDTVVAHLAAGLGKPTWLLLKKVPDWRWGVDGETTFWYPSMRLFRQRERSNWAEVMDRVARALEALPTKELPTKEVESLVPAKMTSLTPEKADGIHNDQREDEQRALALIAQGQLQEAEEIYRRLIKQGARSYLVFSKLGIICARQEKNQEATIFLKEAVAIKADDPEILFHLGVALWKQGDLQAAIDSYKKALALKPNYPEALSNLGATFWKQGNLQAAIDSYKKVLALNPNHPQALSNLGAAFWKQGDLQAAIDSYRKALAIKPDYPDALSNLGSALKDQGQLEAAIDSYRKVLAIKPDDPDALSNLGSVLTEQGHLDDAIDSYRKALTIKPDDPRALYNLAFTLQEKGDLDDAIDFYRKALAIKPDYPKALSNLAFALQEKGDLQTAIEINKKAVSLNPDHALGHLNLSIFLLLSGNYGDGWREYRWRFATKKISPHACPKIEQWNGKNHEPGEKLIIISEQGLSDTLQFMRYIPYLKTMGVDACFCAQPNLHGLIQASGITTRLYGPEEANELTTGKWVPLLSLPAYLNVTPDNPLTDTPYIKVPGQQILHWKQKLAAEPRPIIGLNWQGNPQAENGHMKGHSLSLEALAPITQVTGASFLSLQKGSGSEQLIDCSFRHRFVGCQEEINQTWDFLDSAAIMANCDLIITVDTVVAHLAAGLGKPTWLLLKKVPDWRWGVDGETTFWYPSMRLFRQRERSNWAEVMDRVARALAELPTKELPTKELPTKELPTKELPTKEAESLVPAKMTSLTPEKADGIHNAQREDEQRALALIAQGQLQEAEEIYRRLIKQGARSHLVFGTLGAICAMQDRNKEATTFLKEALAINPHYPEALSNLGYVLEQQGDSQGAINFFRKALAIKPNDPEALSNLGNALKEQGHLDDAIDSYRKALAIKPDFFNALLNLGNALKEQGHLDDAIDSYRKALAIKPDFFNALLNLGNALKEQGHLDDAIDSYRKALAIKPDFFNALLNLGNALKEQGHLDDAIDSYRKALAIKTDYTTLLKLAFALQQNGDLQTAIEINKKAVSLNPDRALGHFNLSIFLLLSGNYGDGWKEYRWRFSGKKISPHACPEIEQWNGKNHEPGEKLIIISEQGLGDTLQFMRYIPYLKTMGVDACFCAQPNLHGLIQASGITTRLYGPEEANALTTGKWAPLLSLPAYLKVTPDNPLTDTPYIKVPGQQVLHWKQKLAAEPRPIIGLNWQGNPQAENGHLQGRSFSLEALSPITQVTGASFLSLQKGSGSEQLIDCSFRHRFVGCQEEINQTWDFLDSAAIMANCDLIITVDTVVAHLAAGLGKPTWLLLKKVPDWRWGVDGETTFWYPSMRLFRQRERGNWAEVMDRVARALVELPTKELPTKELPTKEAESLVPAKMTSLTPEKADGIHNDQREDEQRALALIDQGQLQEAEEIYRRLIKQGARSHLVFGTLGAICAMQDRDKEATTFLKEALAIHPHYPEALSNLGYVLEQQGDSQGAINFFRKALALKPNDPEVLSNLGNALKNQGHLDDAIDSHRKALVIQPNAPGALCNLGCALQERGDLDAAIDSYRKALVLKPNDPEALFNLGNALKEQGHLDDAIDSYRKALAIKPDFSNALSNLGNALKEQGHLDDAIDSYRKALAIKPDFSNALLNLGNALKEQGHLDDAIDSYRKALAIKPDFSNALLNLGNALKEQGHLDNAIDSYRKALAIKPDYTTLLNLAFVLQEKGDLQTAIEINKKAVSLNPDRALGHFNLSIFLLLSGNYDDGWKEYRWRFSGKKISPHACPKVEQWNGRNHVPEEQIIVISEQGLGDTLQFMRYIPYLKTMGVDPCFCAQPNLHGLIQASGITTRLYGPEEANALTTGKWVPLLSLPVYLNVTPDNPLIDTPYIKVPGQQVLHWKQKLAAESRPIIGLNWQGKPRAERGYLQGRSLPLEALSPITQVTGASFLSLQKGSGSEQLMDCSFRHRFVGCQEEINQTWDFLDSAAIMANCDLIITVDTVVAHLAAGLGKPTWLLLKKMPEWRWGMEGETTFWYRSMRLFRQRERGNWAEVMDRVVRALEELPILELPTKEAESLVPAKVSLLTPGKADGIHNAQRKDEQRALALIDQGQLQEAEEIYRRLIKQGARSHLVFGRLGVICAMQDRNQEATTFLKEALAINPHYPEALSNLGCVLEQQGDSQGAINFFRKALAIKPNAPDTLCNLGNALQKRGDLDAAIDSYQKALVLKPNYPEVLFNLGNALMEKRHLDAAIDSYRKALAIKPDFPNVLLNLGNALKEQCHLDDAIDSYRKALAIKPDFPDALSNLAFALQEKGDLQTAIEINKKAVSLNPDHALGHFTLSTFLLLSGNYDDGWKEYRWRFSAKNLSPHACPKIEQWNGKNHDPGEQLIVISEQGLGDTLQFMRYIPYLKTMGVDACFYAQPNLHGLIQASGITTRLYGSEEANALTTGKWVPLLSLPAYLNVTPDNPLTDTPYIKAPWQQILYWKQKLAAEPRPIIGLNWQGNPQAEHDQLKGRSLPLKALAPITQVTGASFLSLQKGSGSEQLMDCWFRHRFVDCQEEINQAWDFLDSAAIMANCDLIITVDTVVAHLAAGLGKPTWLLLKKVPDWRWGVDGETTFWYRSMRLFRQRERGNWAEVMDRVARALAELPTKELPTKEAESLVPAKVTSLTPGKADGIHNAQRKDEQRALALIDQGQLQEAEEIYRRLIKQGARSDLVFSKLGAICARQGKNQEATMFLKEAVAIKADDPGTLFNLGVAFWEQGDLQAAIDSYKKALALNPNHPKALSNLGAAFWKQGDLQAAIDSYRKALAIKPDYPDALSNLGSALRDQGHLEAAIGSYRKALAIKPDYPDALSNLGFALKEQGQLEAAVEFYRKAISLDPDYALGHLNLSHALLLSGNYDDGWKEYRWRFIGSAVNIGPHAYPKIEQWNGKNHNPGERLTIISEQGLGDTLQFMRYIPYLNTMGVDPCFCAQPNLHGLIQASGITTTLYASEEANALATGKWVPLLSLPAYLNVTPDNPLTDTPYIKAAEQQVLHWKQKLAAEHRPIIGISWQASQIGAKGRSLPLEALAPIIRVAEASLLSLQKGFGSEQLMDCSFRHRFVDCQEEINQTWDFLESAAIMANCDLIITVDTVVAHLAAGLGKPTWLLLKKVPDWRWGVDGETTFWYRSMRLFRQRERGNWAEVMDRVAKALEELPTKEAESLVPAKVTSPTSEKDDGINNASCKTDQP